ncbi:MAG TPA: hypothetical protein DCS48_12505 [Desulfovibrio sp.]|nr:hypothetical protein [Desulfovibrio sp.]
MAAGVAYSFGSKMVTNVFSNMAMGAVTDWISGRNSSWTSLGVNAFSGSYTGSASSLGQSGISNFPGTAIGRKIGLSPSNPAAYTSGGGLFGGGTNFLGMMTQFGQTALSGNQARTEVQYNSQMAEIKNYHTMERGVYDRRVSYKEAQLVKQDAELKLATLRRELYRKNHSLSGYKGVRLDSGSIVNVREDTIRQAAYDAEIVKYQAEVNSNRLIEHGDLSVWAAHSQNVMDYNQRLKSTNANNSALNSSLLSQGTHIAGSLLNSNVSS